MSNSRSGHVYLLHGFIASGKSTFAKKLESETGAIRFSPDEWMALLYGENPPVELFDEYYQRIMTLIEKLWKAAVVAGCNVILDFGFWKLADRDKMRTCLEELAAPYTFYNIICDREIALERCRKRNKDLNGSLLIDDNAFEIFESRFEPMTAAESSVAVRSCSLSSPSVPVLRAGGDIVTSD